MAAPILVFGHKNPDNDAISAAVGYAYLKNELAKRAGSDAVYEACRLGGLPPETEWILGENGIEAPRLIESLSEGQQVILVDHNEALQSADGLDAAEIVEIVDHHRLGGLVTAQPLRFNAKPVGSTAAIVAREFEIEGVELPRGIAALLLGAMLTDTVIMKSPTTTDFDRDIIARTAAAVGVDPVEYGMSIFKCRSNPAELPVDKLVNADAKEFELSNGNKVYIGQYETVDLQAVLGREAENPRGHQGPGRGQGLPVRAVLCHRHPGRGQPVYLRGRHRLRQPRLRHRLHRQVRLDARRAFPQEAGGRAHPGARTLR